MINIADEIAELKIEFEYATEFSYKDNSYIDGIIAEKAESEVAVHCVGLDRYLLENMAEVEQVIDFYGWKAVGCSIYGAVKKAQYDKYYDERAYNLNEILLYCALCKLRDEGKKELTEQQFDDLKTWTSVSIHQRLSTVVDNAIDKALKDNAIDKALKDKAIDKALKDKEVITYSDLCDDDWDDDDLCEGDYDFRDKDWWDYDD